MDRRVTTCRYNWLCLIGKSPLPVTGAHWLFDDYYFLGSCNPNSNALTHRGCYHLRFVLVFFSKSQFPWTFAYYCFGIIVQLCESLGLKAPRSGARDHNYFIGKIVMSPHWRLDWSSFLLKWLKSQLRLLSVGWVTQLQNRSCPVLRVMAWNKSRNAGWISVDRSTKATLNTYNTWIQLGRLQKIYHFHCPKLQLTNSYWQH